MQQSLNYALAVHGAPNSSQAPQTAWQFAKAVLAAGHRIIRLFFYQEGVHTATRLTVMPSDEANISRQWQHLIQAHQLEAGVCIASALRRGIIDASEADRHGVSASNLADGYQLVGLGDWLEAIIAADRVITFGA